MGLCQDKTYSLIPCYAKKLCGKVGFVFSLIHASSLCFTLQAVAMPLRKANISGSGRVLSSTCMETWLGVRPPLPL